MSVWGVSVWTFGFLALLNGTWGELRYAGVYIALAVACGVGSSVGRVADELARLRAEWERRNP